VADGATEVVVTVDEVNLGELERKGGFTGTWEPMKRRDLGRDGV
jgi:hypothetical protein